MWAVHAFSTSRSNQRPGSGRAVGKRYACARRVRISRLRGGLFSLRKYFSSQAAAVTERTCPMWAGLLHVELASIRTVRALCVELVGSLTQRVRVARYC